VVKEGTHKHYKRNMKKAVPLLKPDLVLVGVLQLDDLAQPYENNFVLSETHIAAKANKLRKEQKWNS
jgi:hypothetical protein